jgi:hypoxanthine phosphoribosyltransferase
VSGGGAARQLRALGHPIGDVYLSRAQIAERVRELGAELTEVLHGSDPVLVAPLKSSAVFLTDLSRALRIPHEIELIEVAPYGSRGAGDRIALLKDLDRSIAGRHVVVVEDVVDTGLTLAFLDRTLATRRPAQLSAVTLLDRPYRRLVDDLPLRWRGFTVPDELFAGYGLGLDERWRSLPDLHVVIASKLRLPVAIDAA